MPDRRYSVLFYVAILTAIGATVGVYRLLKQVQANGQVATRPVVVATKDLPEGTSLTSDALTVRRMPIVAVPTGAYGNPDSLAGRVLRVPVFSGEAIVPGRLAPVGSGPGLEVKITPGHRAMAVKIDDVAGISGLIQPNSRVDVVVTLRPTQTNPAPVAKLFMENLRVLSVGTTVQRDVDGKPINATTAALEVTPPEAEQLAIAANAGSIQLVLRGFGDPQTVTTRGAHTQDILGLENVSRVESPKPEPPRSAPSRPKHTAPERTTVYVAPPPPPPPPVTPPQAIGMTIYRRGQADANPLRDSANKVRRTSN